MCAKRAENAFILQIEQISEKIIRLETNWLNSDFLRNLKSYEFLQQGYIVEQGSKIELITITNPLNQRGDLREKTDVTFYLIRLLVNKRFYTIT